MPTIQLSLKRREGGCLNVACVCLNRTDGGLSYLKGGETTYLGMSGFR
jgi:hypothetical protein